VCAALSLSAFCAGAEACAWAQRQGYAQCLESASDSGTLSCAGKAFAFDAVCDEKSSQARASRDGSRGARGERETASTFARLHLPSATLAAVALTVAVQEQIFTLVGKNAVDGLLGGYAGCILAYGQARAHHVRASSVHIRGSPALATGRLAQARRSRCTALTARASLAVRRLGASSVA
jgi:hypothetical protein